MHSRELKKIPPDEFTAYVHGLSDDERWDFIDSLEFDVLGEPPREEGRIYFDDVEELKDYMLHHVVSAAKPWRAVEARNHELAHGQAAMQLGAVGVRYCVLVDGSNVMGSEVLSQFYGPATLPNIAWAAIASAPTRMSALDTSIMKKYGYISSEQLGQRIDTWNQQSNRLFIPPPGSLENDM